MRVLTVILMAGHLLVGSADRGAAEPTPPAYQAGGVTTIPYSDPMGRTVVRRDYSPAADDDMSASDTLRSALLALLVGGLSFVLGYLWRKPPPAKPKKQDAIDALTKTFNASREEANVWNRPEDFNDIKKILDKTEQSAKGAVGALFPKDG